MKGKKYSYNSFPGKKELKKKKKKNAIKVKKLIEKQEPRTGSGEKCEITRVIPVARGIRRM